MLTGTSSDLRDAMAEAAGVTDTAGKTILLSIATAMVTWLVSPGNVQAVPGAPPGGLKNVGPVVSGEGRLTVAASLGLGTAVGVASGSLDAAALALWNTFADALCDHLATNARVVGTPFVATTPVPGGDVYNASTITFASPLALGSDMAFTGSNLTTWNDIGTAIEDHLEANVQVGNAPGAISGLLSPPGGGPLTGGTVIK